MVAVCDLGRSKRFQDPRKAWSNFADLILLWVDDAGSELMIICHIGGISSGRAQVEDLLIIEREDQAYGAFFELLKFNDFPLSL